jgi:hypothetical protein
LQLIEYITARIVNAGFEINFSLIRWLLEGIEMDKTGNQPAQNYTQATEMKEREWELNDLILKMESLTTNL